MYHLKYIKSINIESMLRPLINTKSKYQISLVNSKNVLAHKFILLYRKKKKCFKGPLGKLIRIVRELN